MIQSVELDESAWECVEYCLAAKGNHAIVAKIRVQRAQNPGKGEITMHNTPPEKTMDAASKFMKDIGLVFTQLDRMEKLLGKIFDLISGIATIEMQKPEEPITLDVPMIETSWNTCDYCSSETKHIGSFMCDDCQKFNLVRRK